MVLDRISENIASLVQQGMYDNINTDDNTLNGLYDIQFLSNVYTIQNSTTIDGQVIFWQITCQGTIYLIHARMHQLVLETTTS